MTSAASVSARSRADRCPGVLRPWPAEDGALVRLRLVGGRVSPASLAALGEVARRYGDGDVHLTSRANLQLRALPSAPADDGGVVVLPEVLSAIEATGLLPTRAHELVRNIQVSPQSGLAGGRADLRPVARELDRLLCADLDLAALPGKFLFVLDDGRGDLTGRGCDLGLVVLDAATVQLRVGSGWGEVLALADAPRALIDLARTFLAARGAGPDAAWHVDELPTPLAPTTERDSRAAVSSPPLPYGDVPGGRHLPAADGVLTPALLAEAVERANGHDLVVTPWRGLLIPRPPLVEEARQRRLEPTPRRPRSHYPYLADGPAIYVDSFATIRREADLSSLPADAEKLAVRMVHGSGQVDLVPDLVIHPALVQAARTALMLGAPILTDARMVAMGITASRLPADNPVHCLLTDDRVPALAAEWRTTRTAAAVSLWEPHLDGAVVAIGNAPTALFHLLEMLVDGAPRPAAIIGCPVGFIGAAESKEALTTFAADHGIDVPFVTVRGRRGGSAMASSAINALAQEQE